jgi:hypothetical protein
MGPISWEDQLDNPLGYMLAGKCRPQWEQIDIGQPTSTIVSRQSDWPNKRRTAAHPSRYWLPFTKPKEARDHGNTCSAQPHHGKHRNDR